MDNRNTLEEMKRQAELVAQVKEHGIESLMQGPSIPLQSKQEVSADELWERLEDFEIPDSEMYPSEEYQYGASRMKMALLKHIEERYTITKKTK